MNFKRMAVWSVKDSLRAYGIFYLFYIAIVAVMAIVAFAVQGKVVGDSIFNNGTSAIFILVTGIVFFAQYLRIGLANGVSRKSVFVSFGICAVVLAAVAALGEVLLSVPVNLLLVGEPIIPNTLGIGTVLFEGANWLTYFLMAFCSGLAFAGLGIFIGGAYYRMNKITKILVSILVPAALLIGIPTSLEFLPEEVVRIIAVNILGPIINFFAISAWTFMAGCLIIAVIFMVCVYLLIRRAPAKIAAK